MPTDITPLHGSEVAPLTAREILDLVRAAHRAPSIHNTQPWLFRPFDAGLDVLEDPRRGLPASDPRGRDRLISCGAATRNAEIALARLGWRPDTELFPSGPENPLVARVLADAPHPVTPDVEELYRAIWERRTHRRIFMAAREMDDVPSSVLRGVRGFGVRLATVPAHRRARFAQLLWEAAQQQVADEERRAEILRWTTGGDADDGIPARAHGNAPFPVDSLLVRTVTAQESSPPWVRESLASGPIVVLLTDGDNRADWVRAGLVLESVLLTATVDGLVASFLNQVVQQEGFAARLAALLGETGFPQAVLRLGEPLVHVPLTPRRPLTDVTVGWPRTEVPRTEGVSS